MIIMTIEDVFFTNYENRIEIDADVLIVAAWNEYVRDKGGEKIYYNDKEFFENFFENSFDAAWAVSLSGKWDRNDRFIYFNSRGYLTSFTRWNDENSPIDIDKIDYVYLINSLKK